MDGKRRKLDPPKEVRRKSNCPIDRRWVKIAPKDSAKDIWQLEFFRNQRRFSFAWHHLIFLPVSPSYLLKGIFVYLDRIRSVFAID